jgi:hypothetical protein
MLMQDGPANLKSMKQLYTKQTSATPHNRIMLGELTGLQQAAIEWMLERTRVEMCTLEEARGVTSAASVNPTAFKRSLKMAVLKSSDARPKIDRWVELYKKELDSRYGIGDRPDTYPMGLH